MNTKEALNNPDFLEELDMMHKKYIDSMYAKANMQPPMPSLLVPLAYDDAKIQKGLNQLRQGAKNALFAYDKFVSAKT